MTKTIEEAAGGWVRLSNKALGITSEPGSKVQQSWFGWTHPKIAEFVSDKVAFQKAVVASINKNPKYKKMFGNSAEDIPSKLVYIKPYKDKTGKKSFYVRITTQQSQKNAEKFLIAGQRAVSGGSSRSTPKPKAADISAAIKKLEASPTVQKYLKLKEAYRRTLSRKK